MSFGGYARRVRRVLVVALALNVGLTIVKLVVGFRANSLAVIADGLHSGVDAVANVAAILVLRFAEAPADEDHPFGHAKYETLAAFILSGVLLLTAFELGRVAVAHLVTPEAPVVTPLVFVAMAGTLVVNAFVAWLETRAGRREGSDILLADAAQSRGDAYVTIAVLGGLALTKLGVQHADALLALAVAFFIAVAAYKVFKDAMPVLTDRIALDALTIARVVREVPGVVNVHDIRSRGGRRESFVQMHLVVDKQDVAGAHAITDEVERVVMEKLGVKEVFVHVEPEDDASGPPGTAG